MRTKSIGEREQQLLRQLAARISNKLEAQFVELTGSESPNVGVMLEERGHTTSMEIPWALVAQAGADPSSLEAMRVRIKATRDRMLFRKPPRPLPKNITPAADPGLSRGGFGRGGPGRGRR